MPFDGIHPNIILEELAKLSAEEVKDGKKFYKSYGNKWEKLTAEQRNKVFAFWNTAIDSSVQNRIQTNARGRIAQEVEAEKERQAITTKNDLARLLHLRVDPSAAAQWHAALTEKSRTELDANDSSADPFNKLAEFFNNYEHFVYQNACIIPGRMDATGLYVPVPGMDNIALRCHDFNPCQSNRPIRDGGWIRDKYKELKSKISACFTNYSRSGNQDAENTYDEWMKFSVTFNMDIVSYARAIMDPTVLDQMGRAMPSSAGRDTGMRLVNESPDQEAERRRHASESRKRQRLEAKTRASTSNATSPSTGGSHALAAVVEKAFIAQERLSALEMMLKFGNEEQRSSALKEISEISNIGK